MEVDCKFLNFGVKIKKAPKLHGLKMHFSLISLCMELIVVSIPKFYLFSFPLLVSLCFSMCFSICMLTEFLSSDGFTMLFHVLLLVVFD